MTPDRFSLSDLRHAMAAPRFDRALVSEYALVRGLRTHYRHAVRVPRDAMPVVCLHGLAVSHRYLVPLGQRLAGAHEVYLPDLPGFGLSDKPASVYNAAQHADHVAAWLEAAGLPPACVVGHSFGAEVAAALAALHRRTTAMLVLLGPTSDPGARSRRGQVGRFLRDVPKESLLQAPILMRDVWDAGPGRVWATLTHSVRHRVEDHLARVEVPTMVIGGARDPIAPPSWCRRVARLTRAAIHETIPDAAHNVATTSAAQVAELITQFIDDVARDRA